MEDKLQKLYQTLNDQGLYTKTYDDFVTQFSDDTRRQNLHSILTEKGLYTKSYEDFDGQFFSSLKKKTKLSNRYLPLLRRLSKILLFRKKD